MPQSDLDGGDVAAAVLADLDALALTALLDEICRRRGVLAHAVCGRSRMLSVCRARQELWWRIRNHPERHYSYLEIARLFRRDHTTVLHGVVTHDARQRP